MNKIVVLLVAIISVLPASANIRPTNVAQIVERESGGMLTTLFKNTKKVYFVNAQKRARECLIEAARKSLETEIRTPIDFCNGVFDFCNPRIYGELSLYIIDDDKLPLSLVAPEARWAFVNVAHLTKGRGANAVYFEARVRKEVARIASILFGNISSSYNGNLLSFIQDAEGLDKFETDKLPADVTMRCSRFLPSIGVKPYRRISYRKACVEGWAPAPTNEIQRAIWEKVTEVPSKPLKIEFDPAAQKGKVTK